ncbi:MAG TPA: PQQ-dependent sugar dehydrogenase [Egibacteraceae bacterium]|nr:PQQ-dependent sugar dehydrogenase [Egibacteraceae bacterium]
MRRVRRLAALLTVVCLAAPAAPASAATPTLGTTVVRSGLDIPWDLAFAPDGKMLVTGRPGRIRVYASGRKGAQLLRTVTVPKVRAEGEAGLMGIAVTKRKDITWVFVCASRQVDAGWRNQVLRYRLGSGGGMRLDKVVLGGMRAASIHNGCPVEVGPDGKLWVGMGDAADLSLPQKRSSRNGKILRVNLNGSIPADNPFGRSPVYALGIRNPQGIAFYPGTKRAYSIEHGPHVHDEINRLRAGGNYGWPCWTGRSTAYQRSTGCGPASDYLAPAWSSGSSTIATSNGTFLRGEAWGSWRRSLVVSTLKESDVRRFVFGTKGYRAEQRSVLFDGRWGRLRAAVMSPNGRALYLTTSNGGGRDRVIRVRPR